jgi:hypothetical protein
MKKICIAVLVGSGVLGLWWMCRNDFDVDLWYRIMCRS